MTELRALNRATLPQPPSQDIQDFHLIILSNDGTNVLNQFSAYKYAGLEREVACAVAPGGAVKTLTFTGFPHLVGCTGGEIVVFRLNDGDGWQDVFYGAVTQGWAAKKLPGGVRSYVADADYLLNGTVTDATAYPAQDPALIAQDLVRRLRHPELNFTELDFPPTGTALEGGFEQPGIPLGEALKVLAQSVTDSGRTIAYGVDGRGFVFFKELTGTLNVPYYPEDYTDLPINAADTVTAVLWVIGNEPSVPGWSGSYNPGTLTHLSVPDPGLHQQYGRTVALTPTQSNLWIADRSLSGGQSTSGFLNSENAADGNLNTKSDRNPALTTSNGFYQLNRNSQTQPYVYGVRITYLMDYNVVPRASMSLQVEYLRTTPPEQYIYPSVEYALPYTGPTYPNTIDFILPPTNPVYVSIFGAGVNLSGIYAQSLDTVLNSATAYVDHVGTFSIIEMTFLRFNPTQLDAAARAELRTPAQEPAQLILRRAQDRNRVGYYAPPFPKVELSNGQASDAAEYRYAFDRTNGVSTVVDLGSPSREGDAALAERIRLAIDVTAERTKLQLGAGRL